MRPNSSYRWKDESEKLCASSLVTNIMSAEIYVTGSVCVLLCAGVLSFNQDEIHLSTHSTHTFGHRLHCILRSLKMLLGNVVWEVTCWLTLHHALKLLTNNLLYLVRNRSAAKQAVEVGHSVLATIFLMCNSFWVHLQKNPHKSGLLKLLQRQILGRQL